MPSNIKKEAIIKPPSVYERRYYIRLLVRNLISVYILISVYTIHNNIYTVAC